VSFSIDRNTLGIRAPEHRDVGHTASGLQDCTQQRCPAGIHVGINSQWSVSLPKLSTRR
jgi:hypothetical protein